MVGAGAEATNTLRRMQEAMGAQLAQSEFAHQTLTESTAALAQLSESYTSLNTMLVSSRDLLTSLMKSRKSDTWYLQTSLYMLLATAAWLVYRRIFYLLVWWVLFYPFKFLIAGGMTTGRAVGLFGRPEVTSAACVSGTGKNCVLGDAEAVPTVNVGQEAKQSRAEEDMDSMMGKVGKIIDGGADANGEADRENDVIGNPKKRAMQVDSEGDDVTWNAKEGVWEKAAQPEEELPRERDEL